MNRRTSWPPSSRKYSAMVRPDRATRMRAPGGSFIWPNTSTVFVEDARLLHLEPQVVALAGALAHAAERRQALVLLADVADELLDEHRLAHPGAAEQADLAALGVGSEEVDDLDAGLEHLGRRREVLDRRRGPVDRPALLGLDRLAQVDGLAQQVEDPAQDGLADRDRDRAAGVDHLHAAGEPVGGVHGDRADAVVAEVLLDLEDELARARADALLLLLLGRLGPLDLERVVDLGQAVGRERGLDDDALDLLDVADVGAVAGLRRIGTGLGAGFHGSP